MFSETGFHHTNGEMYCAIGTHIAKKDLLHVAAIPLNNNFGVSKEFPLYEMKILPQHPISTHAFAEYWKNGRDYHLTGDLFIEWFDSLGLPKRKKLIAVCYEWAKARPILVEWLGEKNFDYCFSPFYRDIYVATQYLNDVYAYKGISPEFKDKIGLRRIVSKLGLETTAQDIQYVPKSALDRALIIASAYERLVPMGAGFG